MKKQFLTKLLFLVTRFTCEMKLICIFLLLLVINGSLALKIGIRTKYPFVSALVGAGLGLGLGCGTVVEAAIMFEPVTVESVKTLSPGNLDAISAATSSVSTVKQTSLSTSDFMKVKNGEMSLSTEPRALKRRILAACKSDAILSRLPQKISSYECTTKVMNGEIDFMVKVLEDIPDNKKQALVRSYGQMPVSMDSDINSLAKESTE